MDLKEADILSQGIGQHWYYASKSRAVARLLQNRRYASVLDVGAGSGFFAKELLKKSLADQACCVDISYYRYSDSDEDGKPLFFRRSVDETNADLVLLMDVLEHVEDDIGLLCEYVRKANVGTTFVLSVPAFQFMWSGHDLFLEHKRRYTLPQIEQVAKRAGLHIEQGCYYFAAVFPIAATTRLLEKFQQGKSYAAQSQLRKHNPTVNSVLKTLSLMELAVMRYNRCFGLTAFCLAVKKREQGESPGVSTA